MTTVDKANINEACEDVRDNNSETEWALLGYDDKHIVVHSKGTDYQEFLDNMTDEDRFFGYVRFITGDEMSKRSKFVFVAWIGSKVGALKRGKMSTDKAMVKQVVTNFAAEVLAETKSELEFYKLKDLVAKAGGANYGTGSR